MIPIKRDKTSAPALAAGLDIIEFLAANKVAGFSQLCSILPMSKASVSRILKALSARGYVRKSESDGKWYPGARMGMIRGGMPVSELLRTEAPAVLKSFVDATGNTAHCVYWSGHEFQVVAKEQREGGIVMLDVGSIARDLSLSPWGWLFFLSLDKDGRKEALRHVKNPEFLKKRMPVWSKHIKENGFAFDDHEIFPERMRLGAPVYDGGGKLVGAIGTSGTKLSVPPEKFDDFTFELRRHADMLSGKLRNSIA